MKKYKIQLNARAYRDLEEIFEYIANDLEVRMNRFVLHSKYKPTGDQPEAIEKLTEGINAGYKEQTLLLSLIHI